MSSIPSKNTRPEILLGKAMWSKGLRYRKHYPIMGKPDFVFLSRKIAIFCDGDYWHGNNWSLRGFNSLEDELATYSEYWRKKIKSNIERDLKVTKFLGSEGWQVIRIWESEIKKHAEGCAKQIEAAYKSRI